jgi:transcriptional regulator with XRE-family HTH domain
MGLWRFVRAQGMSWRDTTTETRDFLENVTVADLKRQETWRLLTTIVQVMPDGEIFPIRAKYNGDAQYTIGLNHLTSRTPLYYTLADCISAKLLTGRAPRIVQSFSFTPNAIQENLRPVDIAGNPAYRVDPNEDDFFKRAIDLRSEVKGKMVKASPAEKAALKEQQLVLKIVANATSYGIFVELNVEEEKQLQELLCYGPSGQGIHIHKKKFEATGTFFHPLLATLITGAARLMLAITERLAIEAGLDWAFCDTDSMALAKPDSMNCKEFYERARSVQEWFTPLNPYTQKADLLKIEEYNFCLSDKNVLEPLYCYAISSKRYALFNIDENGRTVLRKVSAHGLGHLLAPYTREDNSDLEAEPWQQDLWLEIINAARENRQPNYASLRNFNLPAVSRYGASTPALASWFKKYNEDKAYCDQVRPFNFLLAMQAKLGLKALKPVSTYTKDTAKAASQVFDRMTGQKISPSQLKTYQETLAQYHLHPETKFFNGDFTDSGKTQRRHIVVKSVLHIGKEANKLEEQFYLGLDPEAQLEYGISPEQKDEMLQYVLQAISVHGAKNMADAAKLTERHVLKISSGKANPSEKALAKLHAAAKILDNAAVSEEVMRQRVKGIMEERQVSIRNLAAALETDPSNLAKILSSDRNAGDWLIRAHKHLTGQ